MKKLIKRRYEITERLRAIADAMEADKREMTDEEKTEVAALTRELGLVDLRIQSESGGKEVQVQRSKAAAFDVWLREALQGGKREYAVHSREFTGLATNTPNADGAIPVTVEDFLEPLEQGLIFDKVGLRFETGLAGAYSIPGMGAVTATVEGEGETVEDTEITMEKLTPNPKRVSIRVKITNQMINQSNGKAYQVLIDNVATSVQRVLNQRMFTTRQIYSDALVGPFKALAAATPVAAANIRTLAQKRAAKHILFAGETPTYKELILLRTLALVKGVRNLNGAYIMDAATAGDLRATPKGAGGGRMVLEDGMIDGIPVFETNYINEGKNQNYVGFGYWRYEGAGQFGNLRMIVDPYTGAAEDCVIITVNGNYSMTTLRPEAFSLGQCAGGGSGSGSGN
jgi:HK97 family phage major capsid protein